MNKLQEILESENKDFRNKFYDQFLILLNSPYDREDMDYVIELHKNKGFDWIVENQILICESLDLSRRNIQSILKVKFIEYFIENYKIIQSNQLNQYATSLFLFQIKDIDLFLIFKDKFNNIDYIIKSYIIYMKYFDTIGISDYIELIGKLNNLLIPIINENMVDLVSSMIIHEELDDSAFENTNNINNNLNEKNIHLIKLMFNIVKDFDYYKNYTDIIFDYLTIYNKKLSDLS